MGGDRHRKKGHIDGLYARDIVFRGRAGWFERSRIEVSRCLVWDWEVRGFRMANEEAKLFVAGLPDSISEDVLKQLFEATGGTVVNVSLPKDRATGRPRGFGFVTLSTPAEAQAARDALDGSMQAGKSISVRPFQAEPPRRDAT